MNKYLKLIFDKEFRFSVLNSRGFFRKLDDEKFLKKRYKLYYGRELNLENPTRFTEKLQWLKLYDRRPEYAQMVDKCEAKKYVASIIGDEHIIPTIGVWDSVDEIDFDSLPEKYVVKATHDSGSTKVCNSPDFDLESVKSFLRMRLKRLYYPIWREWPYKSLKPRVIIEEYLEDGIHSWLPNYKFFCFNGAVKMFFIASPNEGGACYIDFYDSNCNHLDITLDGHEPSGKTCEKDDVICKMMEIASALSLGIPQVRVDLYNVNGHIYFGELTLFHASGIFDLQPEKWDSIMGEWINLPNKNI